MNSKQLLLGISLAFQLFALIRLGILTPPIHQQELATIALSLSISLIFFIFGFILVLRDDWYNE